LAEGKAGMPVADLFPQGCLFKGARIETILFFVREWTSSACGACSRRHIPACRPYYLSNWAGHGRGWEVAPVPGGFGFGGIRREHFGGEFGGPVGDFVEVAVLGAQVAAFFAMLALALLLAVTEGDKERFPFV
jgi:hypothetical protein